MLASCARRRTEDRRQRRTGSCSSRAGNRRLSVPRSRLTPRVISHWLTRAVQRLVENSLNHLTLTVPLGISSARIPEESWGRVRPLCSATAARQVGQALERTWLVPFLATKRRFLTPHEALQEPTHGPDRVGAAVPSSLYCDLCAFAGWVAPAALANLLGDAEPEAALGGQASLAEKSLVVRRQDDDVSATAPSTRCETVLCAIARSSWLIRIPVGKVQMRVAAREASASRARRAGTSRTLALRPWSASRRASRGSSSRLLSRAGCAEMSDELARSARRAPRLVLVPVPVPARAARPVRASVAPGSACVAPALPSPLPRRAAARRLSRGSR